MAGQNIISSNILLTDLMMAGSGDGRLSYTYVLSAKREHIDRAIIGAI